MNIILSVSLLGCLAVMANGALPPHVQRMVVPEPELNLRAKRLLNPQNELNPRSELPCNICTDIITDIDNWITDDKTEAEIVEFVEQICFLLGAVIWDFFYACRDLMEEQLPTIIDQLVNQNLNPKDVCNHLGLCP